MKNILGEEISRKNLAVSVVQTSIYGVLGLLFSKHLHQLPKASERWETRLMMLNLKYGAMYILVTVIFYFFRKYFVDRDDKNKS